MRTAGRARGCGGVEASGDVEVDDGGNHIKLDGLPILPPVSDLHLSSLIGRCPSRIHPPGPISTALPPAPRVHSRRPDSHHIIARVQDAARTDNSPAGASGLFNARDTSSARPPRHDHLVPSRLQLCTNAVRTLGMSYWRGARHAHIPMSATFPYLSLLDTTRPAATRFRPRPFFRTGFLTSLRCLTHARRPDQLPPCAPVSRAPNVQ